MHNYARVCERVRCRFGTGNAERSLDATFRLADNVIASISRRFSRLCTTYVFLDFLISRSPSSPRARSAETFPSSR